MLPYDNGILSIYRRYIVDYTITYSVRRTLTEHKEDVNECTHDSIIVKPWSLQRL